MAAFDPLRAARLERRVLGAIVVCSLALMAVGIHWGLPNLESWSGDDVAPEKPLRVLNDWLGGSHKYPYLHWWLNLALYLPWLAVVGLRGEVDLACFPRLRASCFEHPWRDMTVFMALSRLLSVAMGVGIVLGTRRLALALHGDRGAALLAAAIAAGSPLLIFFSHTANLEVPATFWLTWSLVAGVSVWRRGAPVDYALLGLLVACAMTTKDAIAGAYLLPGLALAGGGVVLLVTHTVSWSWASLALGAILAAGWSGWLARFWRQQLHGGRAWTTAGRLIPVARNTAIVWMLVAATAAIAGWRG